MPILEHVEGNLYIFRPHGGGAQPSSQKPAIRSAQLFEMAIDSAANGDEDQAQQLYEQAIISDPSAAGAMVNLGTIHFHKREWSKAEDCYRRATQADPKYAMAYFNLANVLDVIGNSRAAIDYYERAVELNPQFADAYYNLALALQRAGNYHRAIFCWRTHLKLDGGESWRSISKREIRKCIQILRDQKQLLEKPAAEKQA